MSIFPSNPEIGDEFSGKRWNGTAWEVIGVDLSRDYALESSFLSHTSASSSVHGIDNVGDLATKIYADNSASSAAASIIDSAPETLNTLNELAAALGDDANFATTVTNSLAQKLDESSASATYLTQVSASSTYATTATVDTKQDKSSAMVVVNHGSTASTARPTGVGAVYWIGSVQPTNALAYDMWWEL